MGGPSTVSPLQYDAVMTPLVSVEVSSEAKTYDELLAEVDSSREWVEFKVNRVMPGKPVRKSRLSETDESADIVGGSALRQRKRAEDVKDPMAYEMRPLDVDDVTKAMKSWKLKDKDESRTFESNEQLKDPIKWFGVLVPQTLRQSQKHFVTGICSRRQHKVKEVSIEETICIVSSSKSELIFQGYILIVNSCGERYGLLFCAYTAIECAGELAGAQLKVEALRRRYRELLAKKERLKKEQESC